MKITWLGQSSYVFESNHQRLLIDPFLSDIVEQRQGLKRLVQCPLSVGELRPDYIFITHDHMDHFDPIALPQIHHRFNHAVIAGPQSVLKHASALNFNHDNLIDLSAGQTKQFGPFNILATPAHHSDPFAVGGIVAVEEKTIYVSGDTLWQNSLVEYVRKNTRKNPDLILIVINGKLGNMNVTEAIDVVKELKPSLAIPMHYGMFAENTEDPNLFVEGCREHNIRAMLLNPGEEFNL